MEGTLTRDPDDKKRFVLDGVGDFRVGSIWAGVTATITAADGRVWNGKRPRWESHYVVTDAAGVEVGGYRPAKIFEKGNRVGTLEIGDTAYDVRGSQFCRGDTELATYRTSFPAGKQIDVTLHGEIDPLVLLTLVWIVRQHARDSARSST